jgi:hypothetical protein
VRLDDEVVGLLERVEQQLELLVVRVAADSLPEPLPRFVPFLRLERKHQLVAEVRERV